MQVILPFKTYRLGLLFIWSSPFRIVLVITHLVSVVVPVYRLPHVVYSLYNVYHSLGSSIV